MSVNVFQQHLNNHETLKAKLELDSKCKDAGVIPWSIFQTVAWLHLQVLYCPSLQLFPDSTICWHWCPPPQWSCRKGHPNHHVHHKNHDTPISHTLAKVSDPSLWPMAVQYATYLYNKVPDPYTGLCPDDIFTKTRWEQRKFHDLHVWGCPLYGLDKKISNGKKLPHWKPRAS